MTISTSKVLLTVVAGLLLFLSSLHISSSWPRVSTFHVPSQGDFLLGVGKGDITGPVVEINFMGYADTAQVGSGLRQRLYSRAFIVGNPKVENDRFVYLVLDTQSGDTAVRHGILEALEELGDDYAMYGMQNIAVTGTHSHSGPGAWLNYLLPQITSYGFHRPSYQAIVDGAVTSIIRAHQNLTLGQLSIASICTSDININRSPYAYDANLLEERDKYNDNVDKNMTLLRFTAHGKDIGILTWFPVHGTSMFGNNTLVTGDNKGVAAYLYEASLDDGFVAGFSQSNVGDTSPNTEGAWCEFGDNSGEKCNYQTSLCGGKTQPCHGRGPYWGLNDAGTASTYEIGRRQYEAAKKLTRSGAFKTVQGPVKATHHFVNFSTLNFILANGTEVKTCPAALGHSFAAGTSDGPGKFDFKQAQPGDPHTNPLWSVIGNRLHKPNETQMECQGVKPILLDVGESFTPYAWSPNIVDIQTFRAGQLFIIVSPGEATTMAGRRWKAAVHDSALQFDEEPIVVLGGPANSYTHYITTEEEYSVQRYEGASTLYGPHTLAAYINQSLRQISQLASDVASTPRALVGPTPPNNINASLSFIKDVVLDRAGFFKSFGDLLADVDKQYSYGQSVQATFIGANPRNNLRLEDTFAAVERFNNDNDKWEVIRDDRDWSLVYEWKRTSTVLGTSEVTVTWETKWEAGTWGDLSRRNELETPLLLDDHNAYTYRLKYHGDAKGLGGSITPFEGTSGEFIFER